MLMLTGSQQNNIVIFTEHKFVTYPGSQTDSTPWFWAVGVRNSTRVTASSSGATGSESTALLPRPDRTEHSSKKARKKKKRDKNSQQLPIYYPLEI